MGFLFPGRCCHVEWGRLGHTKAPGSAAESCASCLHVPACHRDRELAAHPGWKGSALGAQLLSSTHVRLFHQSGVWQVVLDELVIGWSLVVCPVWLALGEVGGQPAI